MFENQEVYQQALEFVKGIQARIDNSPFKGYLQAGATKGGYIYVKGVESTLRVHNRQKAYRGILQEIEGMADDAWVILYKQNHGDLGFMLQRFLRRLDVLRRYR